MGDLRRFPGLGEADFRSYSVQLLESGVFDRVTLIEGWERSIGSSEEYNKAIALGIPIRAYSLDKIAIKSE